MVNKLELLEAEAMKLTAVEREAFAQLLLASLDADADAEIEEAWAVETERRIADIESGAAQTIPIADALAQVRAALKVKLVIAPPALADLHDAVAFHTLKGNVELGLAFVAEFERAANLVLANSQLGAVFRGTRRRYIFRRTARRPDYCLT